MIYNYLYIIARQYIIIYKESQQPQATSPHRLYITFETPR